MGKIDGERRKFANYLVQYFLHCCVSLPVVYFKGRQEESFISSNKRDNNSSRTVSAVTSFPKNVGASEGEREERKGRMKKPCNRFLSLCNLTRPKKRQWHIDEMLPAIVRNYCQGWSSRTKRKKRNKHKWFSFLPFTFEDLMY